MRQRLSTPIAVLVLSAAAQNAKADVVEGLELNAGTSPPIALSRFDHDALEIQIDGRLDESVWQSVQPIGEMRMSKPDTLAEVPYDTDIRIVYTERGLYLSFDMEQPPETIIERFVARDDTDVSRDSIDFSLDTSGDGLYGYWMGLSLGDSQMDGTLLPERRYSMTWDGAWYGETARTAKGWSAEFYVPWSQLAMPKAAAMRRIGIRSSRSVAHLDQVWGWPWLTETQSRFISRFQPLELHGVDPRQNWSVFPYASATTDNVTNDTRYKAGMDLYWRPSTNFQLTGTVTPDFGSVEADNVVIILTADETFFPEKRLFFQEGREIFQLSGRRQFMVLNTRRIGGRPREVALPPGVRLSSRERFKVADIIGAAKATGQLGSLRYGVITAFEDETSYRADDDLRYTQEGRDFGAVRVLYEDSKGTSYRALGWITTLVAHPEADAMVHGADFHYLSGSGKWGIEGQVLFSDRDETGAGTGGTLDITYTPLQGLKHEFEATLLDDTLDVNDLGFQIRNDVNDFSYELQWTKSGLEAIRDFQLTPYLRYEVNGEGYRTNNVLALNGELTFNNLISLEGTLRRIPRHYDDRSSFGNGTFETRARTSAELSLKTDSSKPVSFFGSLDMEGEYVYGRTMSAMLGMAWRPRHNMNVQLELEHSDRRGWLLHQEGGNFTTFSAKQWEPEIHLEYFPTSKQQLTLAMQWVGIRALEDRFFALPADDTKLIEGAKPPGVTDDFTLAQLNFQVRYRWQIAPLSDLFIVYTKGDRRRAGPIGLDDLFRSNWSNPLNDQVVVKFRYRLGS